MKICAIDPAGSQSGMAGQRKVLRPRIEWCTAFGEHSRQSAAASGAVGTGRSIGLLPHRAQGVIAAYRARGLVLKQQIRIEG